MLQVVRETPLDNEQREYIEAALTSGKNLIRILTDILDLARIESGKMEIITRELTVADLLHATKSTFISEAARKDIPVHYHIDPVLPATIKGDSIRLGQILFNIVGNAIKFTEQGEVHVRVYPEGVEAGENQFVLCFQVSDTGIGIPEEKLTAIFEPFTQVDGSYTREHGGTGLGLAIVKRLVELMNGTIQIENNTSEGTIVCVKVPVTSTAGEKAVEGDPSPVEASPTALKILLAEDDLASQVLARHALETQGHTVICAATGLEALAALDRESFDLVLMDIQMPKLDGLDVTKQLRKDARFNHLPIVALTAHAMAGDQERFLEAGMDDYLSKPIDLEALRRVTAKTMERCSLKGLLKNPH